VIDLVASLAAYVIATCDALEVEVHRTGVAPLALRDAVAATWEGDPCGPRPELRLRLHTTDGVAAMTVQPDQTVWTAGFVAVAAVDADEPVLARADRVALDPGRGRPVDRAGPWVASVPLRAGEALTERVVEVPVAARRGARVSVVVRRGAVRLSVPGHLLADAKTGASVRVRHEASDRILRGRLVNPTTVEIP